MSNDQKTRFRVFKRLVELGFPEAEVEDLVSSEPVSLDRVLAFIEAAAVGGLQPDQPVSVPTPKADHSQGRAVEDDVPVDQMNAYQVLSAMRRQPWRQYQHGVRSLIPMDVRELIIRANALGVPPTKVSKILGISDSAACRISPEDPMGTAGRHGGIPRPLGRAHS